MSKFKHTQDLDGIEMNKTITPFCPMGNKEYTANLNITFKPDEVVPDYIEVTEFLNSLSGKSLIIEDLVVEVINYFKEDYDPQVVRVIIEASSEVHLPVKVSKTYYKSFNF